MIDDIVICFIPDFERRDPNEFRQRFSIQCMKRLVLSCVGLEITRSFESISAFLSKTLLYVQREQLSIDVVSLAGKAVQVNLGFK